MKTKTSKEFTASAAAVMYGNRKATLSEIEALGVTVQVSGDIVKFSDKYGEYCLPLSEPVAMSNFKVMAVTDRAGDKHRQLLAVTWESLHPQDLTADVRGKLNRLQNEYMHKEACMSVLNAETYKLGFTSCIDFMKAYIPNYDNTQDFIKLNNILDNHWKSDLPRILNDKTIRSQSDALRMAAHLMIKLFKQALTNYRSHESNH